MKSIPLWFPALLSLAVGTAYAQDPAEAAKIRHLIASVETLERAQFLRNGRAYDAKAAADHLRLKLKTTGSRVKTADDFIRLCGSKSSLSGENTGSGLPTARPWIQKSSFGRSSSHLRRISLNETVNAPADDRPVPSALAAVVTFRCPSVPSTDRN